MVNARAIGEVDYRRGGLERLRESEILFERELFAGGAYLAGRAVECMFRAVIWKHDATVRFGHTSLDTGHDLRRMLAWVLRLGLLKRHEHKAEMAGNVQIIGRLWLNNMRFWPTAKLRTDWWRLGEIGGRRTMKQAAVEYHEACSAIVKRCEVLCGS